MRAFATAAAFVLAFGAPAAGQRQQSSWEKASNLGSVLGSEAACGLKFDQQAIDIWIEKNVAANDMEFVKSLDLHTGITTYQIKDMPASQKAAHCAQIRRVARANKFIAD